MYNEYFRFTASPFNLTSDPRFFYSNRHYQEAFTGLRWGVKLRRGLMVLTGEAGTGKTTLLRMVTEKFESSTRGALILGPHTDSGSLLQLMLIEFGLPKPAGGQLAMMRKLRTYLVEQLNKNQIVSVLFDEAQAMDVRTIRWLELLLDLENDNEKLLQIVLAGSPELETKLAFPELQSIQRRVALWCRLTPLKRHEIAPYIDYRVMRAGYTGESLFAPDAVEQVALVSKGIPRLINIICDNALLTAYSAGQKNISWEIIKRVSHDLRLSEEFEPKAAVFSSRVEKGEESRHLLERHEENFKARNPVTDDHTGVDEERHWSFEEFPIGAEDKLGHVGRARNHRLFKIAGVLGIFILVASTATLYFGRSRGVIFANSDNIVVLPEISNQVNEVPIPEVLVEKFFGEPSSVQVPMPQEPLVEQESKSLPQKTVRGPEKASLAALKTADINAKVFLHTSKEGDRSILAEIGDALRVKGYTIPETRLSSSRTQGDVRFFFSQDRQDAETVKSIVESELARLGYRISLDVLERDGKKFQFAAPGKIEVWIPPLPESG